MAYVDFPQTYCLGGAARRNVTPPVGMYHRMWGAAIQDRSTGVHRPLWATALALAPDREDPASGRREAQIIVAVDHCLLWTDQMNALRATVCDRAGSRRTGCRSRSRTRTPPGCSTRAGPTCRGAK